MIRPAELRKDWAWCRPLLEDVKAKGDHPWLVEDIYAAIVGGKAAMFVSDEPEGVIVVHPEKDIWSGEVSLFVWAAHCVGGLERIETETYALLDDLKSKVGATKIVMHGRPGWQKRGWKIKQVIFER